MGTDPTVITVGHRVLRAPTGPCRTHPKAEDGPQCPLFQQKKMPILLISTRGSLNG